MSAWIRTVGTDFPLASSALSGNKGTAASKVAAFEAAGVPVAETMDEVVAAMRFAA